MNLGSIIFGGIDTKKFYGKLSKHPIIPAAQSPDTYPRFDLILFPLPPSKSLESSIILISVLRYWINMTSLSLTPPAPKLQVGSPAVPKVFLNSTIAVFLDSGGTLVCIFNFHKSHRQKPAAFRRRKIKKFISHLLANSHNKPHPNSTSSPNPRTNLPRS